MNKTFLAVLFFLQGLIGNKNNHKILKHNVKDFRLCH